MPIRLPDIWFCDTLKMGLLCHTLSKVLEAFLTSSPSSNDWNISCVVDNSWLMQEDPGLNPEWFVETRLSSSKN